MEDRTKERVTGFVVFVAFAVIFVPMMFNRASTFEVSNAARIQRIPQAPISQLQPIEIVKPAIHLEPLDQMTELAPLSQPKHKPVITHPEALVDRPQAWIIQLGSFSKRDNAEKLVRKLQDKGFAAFINQLPNQNDVTTVLIGPEPRRDQANILAEQIHEEMNLKGIVIRYQVT